jgi:hypothetical protein
MRSTSSYNSSRHRIVCGSFVVVFAWTISGLWFSFAQAVKPTITTSEHDTANGSTVVARRTIDVDRLVGVPFLKKDQPEKRSAIKAKLQLRVMKRLKELQNWPSDYSKLPQNKAIAIRYDEPSENPFVPYLYRKNYIEPHISFWGGSWGDKTIEAARSEALKQCGEGCVVYLENDRVQIAERMVDEILKAKQEYVDDQIKALTAAEKLLLIDRAYQAKKVSISRKVSLSPIRPIDIGYPDWQQDYSSVCQDRVFNALIKLNLEEKAYLRKLRKIVEKGLYDPYDRTVNTTRNFKSPGENAMATHMARFARKYVFKSMNSSKKALTLPQNLSEALSRETIKAIWVEGSVRVTGTGLPLVIDEQVNPLAIKTDKNFYLGVQVRLPDAGDQCYVSKPFSNNVLDISACTTYECAKNAFDALLGNLKYAFRQVPIQAEEIQNETFAPGEFGMKREYQPSSILGAPYYELSTYTVETWIADRPDPFYSLYQRQKFKGLDKQRFSEGRSSLLFLKVSHVLTTSAHKNGTYSEPTRNQVQKFETIVKGTVENTVVATCNSLRGTMNGTVCKIP